MIRALTFADLLAEERARVLREGGWSDAARLAALCARTRDPKYCSQVKSSATKAVAGTVKKVADTAKAVGRAVAKPFGDPTDPEDLRLRREMRKEHVADYEALKQSAKQHAAQRGRDPEKGQHAARDTQVGAAVAKDLDRTSPRHLTGPKKGKVKKGWQKTATAFAFQYSRT
jgi:hypothetical protein